MTLASRCFAGSPMGTQKTSTAGPAPGSIPSARQASSVRSVPRPKPIPDREDPADRLHQAVVPATSSDPGLRAEQRMLELEGRARVVVKAAHESRGLGPANSLVAEVLANAVVVVGALLAQVIHHEGCLAKLCLHRLALVVEDTQRIDAGALVGGFIEIKPVEECLKQVAIGRAAAAAAQRRQQEVILPQAQ